MIVPPATHVKRRREATDVSAVRGATDGVAVIRPAACGERDGATVLDHGGDGDEGHGLKIKSRSNARIF
jgi:hypothetical protein